MLVLVSMRCFNVYGKLSRNRFWVGEVFYCLENIFAIYLRLWKWMATKCCSSSNSFKLYFNYHHGQK